MLGTMGIPKTAVVGGIMMLALLCLSLPGEAGVKPGDFITPDNAAQVTDLVSPGVFLQSAARHDDENRSNRARRLAASV